MIRVLHLRPHAAEFEAARGADALARAAGEGFAVAGRTLWRGGDRREVPTAAAMLRREAGEHDLVHAWGGAALAVAALGSRGPIVFSPATQTRVRTVRWLRAVLAHRRVEVICPTSTLHRRLVERGVPGARCHLIRPGVDFSRVRRRRDAELRSKLGLGETDYVFLAAGESTRPAGHVEALWAASILHVADPRYKLLTWGRGPGAGSVRNFADKTEPKVLRVAEPRLGRRVEFEDLLPAADAVLVTAKGAVATLPIAICMAAALPIVATVTPIVAELLEDRHTALMSADKPRLVARRALDLLEDPNLQWSISDMARTEAYEFFAQTRFLAQFRAVYRQSVESDHVEVPEQAPGAGLRFHGRA
jgi:glycosyltransferase involved in cell wall biosynthesis